MGWLQMPSNPAEFLRGMTHKIAKVYHAALECQNVTRKNGQVVAALPRGCGRRWFYAAVIATLATHYTSGKGATVAATPSTVAAVPGA